ncbi:MAG: preprotein translocase subunit YajC [Clostridia bacterium]|nr:preprotein translocase subunit YajC [Clostridia bacterium]
MLLNLFNLLSDTPENQGNGNGWVSYVIMGGALLLIIVLMIFTRRSQKKKQDETNAMLDAIAPGNKVKTIGGICGVVVEVCKEDNTFILETGSEESGKSYIKFDKQAIFQTDAKPVANAPAEESAEAPDEESAPTEEVFTETAPEATEEKAE